LKTSILTAAIVALVLTAAFASAQDQAAPAQPAIGMDAQMSQMHENMVEMHSQIEERMGMMTTMVQQMLDHLQVMESMPAK
jgi:hypothetical protein